MSMDIPEYIKKVLPLVNLKEEDVITNGFRIYLGKIQKGKRDDQHYRLTDTVIEIPGVDDSAIGIRAYRYDYKTINELYYRYFWKQKSDKIYGRADRKMDNIVQAFIETYKIQESFNVDVGKGNLPCHEVYVKSRRYIEVLVNAVETLLYDPINDYIIRYDYIQDTDSIIIPKKGQAKLKRYGELDFNECKPIYSSVHIVNLDVILTVQEYLAKHYFSQFDLILKEFKKRIKSPDITSFFKK